MGQSSCYSQLGNVVKARELLEFARMCAVEDRQLLSQVEMSEGSLYAQTEQHDLACQTFLRVKSQYKELLDQPANDDFAEELDARLACALCAAGKYPEAILLFEGLFKREQLADKQRLQMFFGVALLRTGRRSEAQHLLLQAMRGGDPKLAETSSDYFSETGGKPSGPQ